MTYNKSKYNDALQPSDSAKDDAARFRRAWAPQSGVAHGVSGDSTLPFQEDICQNRNPLFNTPYVADEQEGYRVAQKFPGYRNGTVYAYRDPDGGSLVYEWGPLERSAI